MLKEENTVYVSICIATCKRPKGLHSLLGAIVRLRYAYIKRVSLEVIVVDNDINCSAKVVCEEFSKDSSIILRYIIEKKSGIPFARNLAMRSISSYSQFIVFIDDDEIPEENWLDELLNTQQKYKADVVTGPVLPLFEKCVTKWIKDGKFFERRRYKTGTVLPVAFTCNTLLCVSKIKSLNLWFDETWPLAGGSDTRLFYLARQRGAKIVWADTAVVYEYITESRTNMKWIIMREWRTSLNYTRIEIECSKSLFKIIKLITKAIIRIGQGIILFPLLIFGGRETFVKALRYVVLGLGTFGGLFGIRYNEYKYLHTSE